MLICIYFLRPADLGGCVLGMQWFGFNLFIKDGKDGMDCTEKNM